MKRKWIGLVMLFSLVWMMVIPAAAGGPTRGGSYHAPAVTIITENAPRDLEITMNIHRHNGTVVPTQLEKKTRVWEQQFRLYRAGVFGIDQWYGNAYDLKDAELVLVSGGKETVIPLSQELTDRMNYNDILTLDYRAGTVSLGAAVWRGPLMLAMRLIVVTALEVVIFRLFRYREKRSLLIVAAVTLATFGLLSIYTYNWLNSDPRRLILYILFSIILLTVQTLVFVSSVEENYRDKTLTTTIWASLTALVANYAMLVLLPV